MIIVEAINIKQPKNHKEYFEKKNHYYILILGGGKDRKCNYYVLISLKFFYSYIVLQNLRKGPNPKLQGRPCIEACNGTCRREFIPWLS